MHSNNCPAYAVIYGELQPAHVLTQKQSLLSLRLLNSRDVLAMMCCRQSKTRGVSHGVRAASRQLVALQLGKVVDLTYRTTVVQPLPEVALNDILRFNCGQQ